MEEGKGKSNVYLVSLISDSWNRDPTTLHVTTCRRQMGGKTFVIDLRNEE